MQANHQNQSLSLGSGSAPGVVCWALAGAVLFSGTANLLAQDPGPEASTQTVKDAPIRFVIIPGWGLKKKTVTRSPDLQHHAYCLSKDNGRMAILIHDGQEVVKSWNVDSLVFSPDSSRLAAFAHRSDSWRLVLDGETTSCPRPIGLPMFSPDSKRVAYWSRDIKRFFLVVDGQIQREYDAVRRDSLTFTPDSSQPAYLARQGDRWYIVTGETEHPIEGDPVGTLVFDEQAQGFVLREDTPEPETSVAEVQSP